MMFELFINLIQALLYKTQGFLMHDMVMCDMWSRQGRISHVSDILTRLAETWVSVRRAQQV